MANVQLNGEDVVGVENVEYTFEPFRFNVYARPKKKPVVVKGAPQLRTVRVSGVVTGGQLSDIQKFEDKTEPVSFTSPVVSLSQCVIRRIRMTQNGNDPISYTIELQEVDEFIEVDKNA